MTKKKLLLATLFFCAAFGQINAQTKNFNQPLADSLAKWVVVDQIAAKVPQGEYKLWPREKWNQYKDSIFSNHQQLLSAIFKKYGYLGYDQVGQKGSFHFWLMVQHCDKWPAFQQEVLEAMKVEVYSNNTDRKNFAYLTDRVNLNTGKKQIYATQVTYNVKICQAIPKPLADSLNVNKRRREMGMPPVEEYLNEMSKSHFEMNRANYEKQGILKPVLVPVPKGV